MLNFLRAGVIKDAISRLTDSRASKSLIHFLVFKRAKVRVGEDVVVFSQRNGDLAHAVDDLTRVFPNVKTAAQSHRSKPHFNPFGSAGSTWQFLGSSWRENGTGPTLSGAAWKDVIDYEYPPVCRAGLQDVLGQQVADPLAYLPDLDAPSQAMGDLAGILDAFAT